MISPPLSPFDHDELPSIATDEKGMILGHESDTRTLSNGSQVTTKRARRPRRQPIRYVSRHFSTDPVKEEDPDEKLCTQAQSDHTPTTPPITPAKQSSQPRIYFGVNVDAYSSDSSLTDVPDDIGPDPFTPPLTVDHRNKGSKDKAKTKARHPTTSPFFPSPHRHRPIFLSTLPFPPLSVPRFGLMQERLAHDPFRLLIATIFLNKTPGERAMPIFFELMSTYPTPADLADAEVADVTAIIQTLGFQNQRAKKCVAMARVWSENEPMKGRRWRKRNYPLKGDGRDVKEDEVLDEEDERVGWEISHLPGIGAYGHDSWRMFCRDRLRGLAEGWNGEGTEEGFEPEWKRVLPLDKELRAWMTWMWLKEGWIWNKETGQKTKASEELMEMANGGGVVVEEREKDTLTVKVQTFDPKAQEVARPAGKILDDVKRES
jgi:methyl-CpG-binding domain protein 4